MLFSSITKGELLPSKILSLHEDQLVRCLSYISHRYFAPQRTVIISSSPDYGNVLQELIAEIHRTSIWTVVVTVDGNISKSDETYFIHRDSSYIILIPDGNITSLKDEFLGLSQHQKIKYKKISNSDVRFVVAGANEFSMSQQKDIFNYLSKLRIYNCIIVSREYYIIDKNRSRINLNEVDTSMKLGVYTWFPYRSSDRCTEVIDITLLDSWVISAQGHFTNNTDLFPRKISNSLNGCPMKAVVRNCGWNLTTNYIQNSYSNGSVVTYVKGLEMDLLRLVLKQVNMTFIHVPTPGGFECGIEKTHNLTRAMNRRKVYIAVGHVGTHFLSDPFLDSSNYYYFIGVSWYVPCSLKNPRWSSIFRILSVELWLVLLPSIVIAAILSTLLGRYSCTSEWQGYKTLSSSLTNVWAVILGVAVPTMPRTPSVRSLFLAWVCFSVAFSTVFQAFLTTFLIDSGYKTPIQNMDELFSSGMKLSYSPVYRSIFENDDETALKVQRNRANCPSFRACLLSAIYHKNASMFFADLDAEGKYASGMMLDENSEPALCRLEDGVVYNDGLRMAMLQGDPLMKRVSEIIDRVVGAGLYNYWISREINSYKLLSRKIAISQPLDGYYSFSLYHVQPAFYLLLMGWCLSVLCFMFELLYYRVLSIRA